MKTDDEEQLKNEMPQVTDEETFMVSKIPQKVKDILESADKSLSKIQKIKSGKDLLFEDKFGTLGTRWNNPESEGDLGEQIQQSMTMLVSYFAIDLLCNELELDEKTKIEINAADQNGPDISFEYQNKYVFVEVFATKNPYNNNKLFHDLKVLADRGNNTGNCEESTLYIVFCSEQPLLDSRTKCKKEDIEILKITDSTDSTDLTDLTDSKEEPGFIKSLIEYKRLIEYKHNNNQLSATIIHIKQEKLKEWMNSIKCPFE